MDWFACIDHWPCRFPAMTDDELTLAAVEAWNRQKPLPFFLWMFDSVVFASGLN
jgi:hypothetical protein